MAAPSAARSVLLALLCATARGRRAQSAEQPQSALLESSGGFGPLPSTGLAAHALDVPPPPLAVPRAPPLAASKGWLPFDGWRPGTAKETGGPGQEIGGHEARTSHLGAAGSKKSWLPFDGWRPGKDGAGATGHAEVVGEVGTLEPVALKEFPATEAVETDPPDWVKDMFDDKPKSASILAGLRSIGGTEVDGISYSVSGALVPVGEAGGLTHLNIHGVLDGRPGPIDVHLPTVWLEKFEPYSVRVRQSEPLQGATLGFGIARLAAQPWRQVQFTVMESGSPHTSRELHMLRLLRDTGAVPVLLDTMEFPDVTYILTERAQGDLNTVLARPEGPDQADAGDHIALSPGKAVALMARLLRHLVALEEAHVVHGELTEANVGLAQRGARPFFKNFRASCLEDGADDSFRCGAKDGEVEISAMRLPPEALGEQAQGQAGNVFQLGLVFARMIFGGIPTEEIAEIWFPNGYNDVSKQGRRLIRAAIRTSFKLGSLKGYQKLRWQHWDLMDLAEGMLDVDPARRWTARKALDFLEDFASKEGLPLPPRGEQEILVQDWLEAWQQE